LVQMAAIELSMYHRDDAGLPRLASVAELPPSLPEPSQANGRGLEQDIETALARRPEVQALAARQEQTQLETGLARNQLLPNLDLVMGYSRDRGIGAANLRPAEFEAAVTLEIPLQRRKAKGKLQAEEAKLEQLRQKERLARDRVAADVRDAHSALIAARERVRIVREEVDVARQLEDAERTRFDFGDSTLFLVNLRELATADAAVREVAGLADYHRARADYEAAIAAAAP